jgi:hypothetical protein
MIKENGAIAHLQRLVTPSDNHKLKNSFPSRFLPLTPKQVIIENRNHCDQRGI